MEGICDISGGDAAQCAAAVQEVKKIVLDGRERDGGGGGDGGGIGAGLNHNRRPPQVGGRTAAAAVHCAAVAAARARHAASPIITTFVAPATPTATPATPTAAAAAPTAATDTDVDGPVRVRVRSLPRSADAEGVGGDSAENGATDSANNGANKGGESGGESSSPAVVLGRLALVDLAGSERNYETRRMTAAQHKAGRCRLTQG